MAIYDYTCMSCGRTREERGRYSDTEIVCTGCGGPAKRRSVYLTSNVTDSGATVPLSDRRYNVSEFQEASGEINHAHVKAENEQGRKLESPDLYRAGVERARQMGVPIRAT